MSTLRTWLGVSAAAVTFLSVTALPVAAQSPPVSGVAPGAPGAQAVWTEADKDGFGTSTSLTSRVWHTLDDGRLTEVYFPDLGTPSVRDLQFIVSDGRTFSVLERDGTGQRTELVDARSLTYRQVTTDKLGRFRLTKTYVTDPARDALLIDVAFESITRQPYQVYVLFDPALSNDGMDDDATSQRYALLASDGQTSSALTSMPRFTRTSSGYLGTSDGWTDLRDDHKMDWAYTSAPDGNVVQTARTALDGTATRRMTLALGFAAGGDASGALRTATAALGAGFSTALSAYQAGWHAYLDALAAPPASVGGHETLYNVSLMVLAAAEDKTYRGAGIASPSMPWVWGAGVDGGPGLENPSGAYHLVWSRDLYQAATTFLAAGDRHGAERALRYLFERQQRPDGSFPQNSTVDGTEHWTNTQMDEVAFPLVLAWQLGMTDGQTWRDHIKPAADYVVANGPFTPQERWENQCGYSPGTIAAEIAGLICAADIARDNGDETTALRYEATADQWQQDVESLTATTNGPYSPTPYYLRLTKDGNPDSGTTYSIGDGGPSAIDQRAVVDTTFLELVRLGVKPADDPVIRNSVAVVDEQLGVGTPNGTFWHRFNEDGYGETLDGGPWRLLPPDTPADQRTYGRIWPIFAGERGEYELLAGDAVSAPGRLSNMAAIANEGFMLPEQVWDEHDPSGQPGFPRGEGTFSATPLIWTHAQFIRLAWSIQQGTPVERPAVVACRYTGQMCN
jgi:glucoamylase